MKNRIYLGLIFFSAAIASLGTYPYAKDFSHSLFVNHRLSLFVAAIFVPAALSANLALGAYSLKNSIDQTKQSTILRNFAVYSISLVAALSTAFMCFIGYKDKLPLMLNLGVSFAVMVVNAGIGFSAINNAINDLSNAKENLTLEAVSHKVKKRPLKITLITVTVLSALLVTLTAYFAITHGLSSMAQSFHVSLDTAQSIIYVLAIFIWFPGAVLFANGSRVIVSKLYDSITHHRFHISMVSVVIAIIAFSSGSAYAQMALEFFNQCKDIPVFFKQIAENYNVIFYFFMPLAFVISAVVNGYALNSLLGQFRKGRRAK